MGSLYRSMHELLPLFKKGDAPTVNNVKLGKKGRWRSNLWTYPGASSLGSDARRGLQDHPTVKPTAMLEDALLDLTNRGDIVLDPFLGSGSTLIAAETTGRICRGVELDPLYVDVIIRRYQAATGQAAVLIETGETFEALGARRALAEMHPSRRLTSDLKEEVIDPTAPVLSPANRGGDDVTPPSIPDAVGAVGVDKIATGERRDLPTKPATADFGDESDLKSDQSAGGGEADPRTVAADEEARRDADSAMNIAIATRDSRGETAAANDGSSCGAPSSAVALLRPEKSAGSSDHGAVMMRDGQEGALASAEGFDEIERDGDGGPADVCVSRANEYIAGELAVRADGGPLDGMADPETVLASDGADEADNISVWSENAQKQKENDMANDAPDERVPLLGVTLLGFEKSAGGGSQGVVIMEVDRNGPAASEGLKAGNAILEAGGKKVSHPGQVIAAIGSAKKVGHGFILLRIKTANTIRIVRFALEGV
jgi:DNA methylase/PDZ domain